VIVCVDFSGFNRRFARAVRARLATQRGAFANWRPRIVQYVSPQVWASRADRAASMARDFDLLLCIFPFERDWYAARVPDFPVEFVGHPIVDRYANLGAELKLGLGATPAIVLLPGSRVGELRRHLPPMFDAARRIAERERAAFTMILPNESLAALARPVAQKIPDLRVHVGGLARALRSATLAIASTGTVTMECAYFRVPTIALYKTSWSTYQIGKRIIQVSHLAMPNLLAGETIFPEFIQSAATGENLANAAIEFLRDPERRAAVKEKLAALIASLGAPGAARRAAARILDAEPS
jgi:lipid-A-disaccharide synthase